MYFFFKRLIDLFLSLNLLVMFVPVFILVLLVILIFDRHYPFFIQERSGLNGKKIYIYKFKTMKQKEEDLKITFIGNFLRISKLDELPQIFNVFIGNMSFIGPRPPIPSEVVKYELKHLKRISVKPGITGLWQVTLRNDNDFDNWVEKDIEYIDNWSFDMDLKIFIKTFREIFKLTGS